MNDALGVSPDFNTLRSTNANLQLSHELAPGGAYLADGRPVFSNTRIDPRFGNIQMAESAGNSNYNGLNITLNRRFSN